MEIQKIQEEIAKLFKKYRIPALTLNLPMENLHQWAYEVANHFHLDQDEFRESVTELFWSIAHIQISLGYALIARQSCEYPKGTQGIAFHEKDLPNVITMPEIHFWFHIYNSYECLYRCWERITSVIKNVCYPNLTEKRYFDQIINDLAKDKKFNQNVFLKSLQKQIKNWSKIVESRNKISHGKSSPLCNMSIQGKASDVLGIDGLPIIYLEYSVKNLKEELEHVIDKYRKVLPVIKNMKEFIDNIDN